MTPFLRWLSAKRFRWSVEADRTFKNMVAICKAASAGTIKSHSSPSNSVEGGWNRGSYSCGYGSGCGSHSGEQTSAKRGKRKSSEDKERGSASNAEDKEDIAPSDETEPEYEDMPPYHPKWVFRGTMSEARKAIASGNYPKPGDSLTTSCEHAK